MRGGPLYPRYALLNSDIMTAHPPPELWRTHREWFWPRVVNATHNDSKTFGQLCWGNASMVQYMIKQMKKSLHFWTA